MSSNTNKPLDSFLIFLLSFCVIVYQIAVTRLLSVVLWYHFAFLSISLAMIGIGLPSVWYAVFPPVRNSLYRACLGAALFLPLSVVVIVRGAAWLPRGGADMVYVSASIVSILLAMIPLGAGICILLLRSEGRSLGKVYGYNLLGAAAGAIAAVPLMCFLPAPIVAAALGFLPLISLFLRARHWGYAAMVVAFVLSLSLAVQSPFTITRNKLYAEEDMGVLYEKWTPSSRVTVLEKCPFKEDQGIPWGWGYGSRYDPVHSKQLWIDQDGSAGMPVEDMRRGLGPLDHLMFDVTGVGYQLKPQKTVAVIGAGGGRDVLTALRSGAESVDAVEINPAIVNALSSQFDDFSGDVYHLHGVNAVVAEGRSYLTRAEKSYDLIQLSLVDTWAATAAGAYALSENYLYTIEAFQLYFDRLNKEGILSVSRYMGGIQHMEGARMAALCVEAIKQAGFDEPGRHIAILRGRRVGTFLVKMTPWSEDDIAKLESIAALRGFDLVWLAERSVDDSAVAKVMGGDSDSLSGHGLDISAPTDNRPFFFQCVSFFSPLHAESSIGFNGFAVVLLRRVVCLMAIAAVILFLLPFLLKGRLNKGHGFWRGTLYFAAIGAGFMLIEISWVQKFILYMGNPSYAMSVVVGSLLFGAGLGATISSRMADERLVFKEVMLLPVSLLFLQYILGSLPTHALDANLLVRLAIAVALIVPMGIVMGFAFPVGLRRFGDENKAWFIGVNGLSGVLGGVFSLALAMAFGYMAVIAVGLLAYAVAALMMRGAAPDSVNGG